MDTFVRKTLLLLTKPNLCIYIVFVLVFYHICMLNDLAIEVMKGVSSSVYCCFRLITVKHENRKITCGATAGLIMFKCKYRAPYIDVDAICIRSLLVGFEKTCTRKNDVEHNSDMMYLIFLSLSSHLRR